MWDSSSRRDPPRVRQGDLLSHLPDLISQAPDGATVVVFHSAVLGYVRRPDRARFATTMRDLGVAWLANEGPGLLPDITMASDDAHGFILVKDGTQPLAVTDSRGTWLHWL